MEEKYEHVSDFFKPMDSLDDVLRHLCQAGPQGSLRTPPLTRGRLEFLGNHENSDMAV